MLCQYHPDHIDCAAGPEGHHTAKGEAQHGGSCLGDVRTAQCVFGRDTATVRVVPSNGGRTVENLSRHDEMMRRGDDDCMPIRPCGEPPRGYGTR